MSGPITDRRPVVGYEGIYEVDALGQIHSLPRTVPNGASSKVLKGRVMKYCIRNGYFALNLCRDGKAKLHYVHSVVCQAFHGAPSDSKMEVAHRDGCSTNNAASNLLWATHSENEQHKKSHGTDNAGSRHPMAKLGEAEVRQVIARVAAGETHEAVAHDMGVHRVTVSDVIQGRTWGHISRTKEASHV